MTNSEGKPILIFYEKVVSASNVPYYVIGWSTSAYNLSRTGEFLV